MKNILVVVIIVFGCIFVLQCSQKSAQPDNLPEPTEYQPESTYVMVTPAWESADGIDFDSPSDVIIGYDRCVYIADQDNDRVVKMSLTGEFIESYQIEYPTQIAQDRGLDLLAVSDSSVILRRSYKDGGDFEIVYTAPDVIYPPPPEPRPGPALLFGVTASPLPEKDYVITNYFMDEIYTFDKDDEFTEIFIEPGVSPGTAIEPVCVNSKYLNGDYYLMYTSGGASYSIQVVNGLTGDFYIADTDSADIYTPTMSGYKDISMDDLGNIYVSFTAVSEVWKYNRNGIFVLSFGQDGGQGETLYRPRGIYAYQDLIYIADAGNNRIVRFQSSTAVQN